MRYINIDGVDYIILGFRSLKDNFTSVYVGNNNSPYTKSSCHDIPTYWYNDPTGTITTNGHHYTNGAPLSCPIKKRCMVT